MEVLQPPSESPHFELGRFCTGCWLGLIPHIGCEVDGTAKAVGEGPSTPLPIKISKVPTTIATK